MESYKIAERQLKWKVGSFKTVAILKSSYPGKLGNAEYRFSEKLAFSEKKKLMLCRITWFEKVPLLKLSLF